MGEYLSLYTKVREYVCGGDTVAACAALKKLLNYLNADYVRAPSAEREKFRKAIVRLLPALQDLKENNVSDAVVAALQLDPAVLPFRGPRAESEPKSPQAGADGNFRTEQGSETLQKGGDACAEAETLRGDDGNSRGESEREAAQAGAPARERKKGARTGAFSGLTFEDYVGQERIKRSLRITLAAAKKAGGMPAHLLICSPYGYGKTMLANVIANEAGLPFFSVNAANLKDVRSVLMYFSRLKQSGIVFIDEIHTLKKEVQTALLSVMTEFAVRLVDEEGTERTYEVPPFMLIGATTQAGELLKPFVNRFSVIELEEYTEEEARILAREKLKKLGFSASDGAVSEIVKRSRMIPRTIGIFAKGAADVALAGDKTAVGTEETDLYFVLQGIDERGLTKSDRLIMNVLAEAQRPLALVTLESKSGIQREDIEYRIEPYLLKLGFVEKTERGRILTAAGKAYLNAEPSAPAGEEEE